MKRTHSHYIIHLTVIQITSVYKDKPNNTKEITPSIKNTNILFHSSFDFFLLKKVIIAEIAKIKVPITLIRKTNKKISVTFLHSLIQF